MKPSQVTSPKGLIEPGTIILLGEHRLLCGDATDGEAVSRLIGDDKIKLILTDPPYGVAYVEGKHGFAKIAAGDKVIANDHDQTEDEYAAFTKAWLEPIVPYLAKKNACYIFNSDKMLFALREGMRSAGWKFSQLLVWVKTHAVIGRMDHLPQHEYVAYGWHGTHKFLKSKDKSVLVHPKPSRSKLHSTMKPVGLLRRLILNVTTRGDVVYEGFGGSGSTLIACEHTQRRCFAIELDQDYCETIARRWERCTGKRRKYG